MQRWFSEEQRVQRELQLFFLQKLFSSNGGMVFKGGTALDLFYGSGRFSEDLDFDCKNLDVLVELNGVIGSLKGTDEYAVFNDWKAERELHKNFVRYFLRVSSKRVSGIVNFMVDCTIDVPKYKPDRFGLSYKDSIVSVMAMKPEEILAEKVCAVINRNKARDLYDLYYLAVVKRVQINLKDVYEKCEKRFSARKPNAYSFKAFEAAVKRLRGRWRELDALIKDPADYPFREVSESVLELFKSL